jgi:hypothetical protein
MFGIGMYGRYGWNPDVPAKDKVRVTDVVGLT